MSWSRAVTDPRRVVDYRVEAVSVSGQSLGDVPVDGVRIEFDGDRTEAWGASFALSDPSMVPLTSADTLDGRSATRLRVWWRVLDDGTWLEIPVGTFCVTDPRIQDSGSLSITVDGLDPLAAARRGGYGASVISVGGMTVSDALATLFAAIAPGFPVSIEPSTATLPAVFDLWDRDPADDWREIAAAGGMVVRTDRWGVITAARQPTPETVAADWQEGPSCPVTDLDVEIRTSSIPRRVIVVSSSPDVSPPVVGVWDNPDADSQALTYEMRIQSSTVTTAAAATSLAALSGQRWSKPQSSVSVTVPARPDLAYGDLVLLRRAQAAVSGPYRVAGWALTLAGRDRAPEPMSVRMMARQW